MSNWDAYPSSYRSEEVNAILAAVSAGECAAVAGLSGSGKTNLLGFLAHRVTGRATFVLVDCNRMEDSSPAAFYRLVLRALGRPPGGLADLESALSEILAQPAGRLCLLLDRFDALDAASAPAIHTNLRALRDEHKYALSLVVAARRPPDPSSELGELFFAHTLWLGPLAAADGRWSASQFAARHGLEWQAPILERLVTLSGGYPSLLRAACEAYAAGAALDLPALRDASQVRRRVEEFWADHPTPEMLALSRLQDNPLLAGRPANVEDTSGLTASELRLLTYLQAHPGQVCSKDELASAVWPEDRVFGEGIRDDSLAQLVRRLREKIEANPSSPLFVLTVPGRGYKYSPPRGEVP